MAGARRSGSDGRPGERGTELIPQPLTGLARIIQWVAGARS
jgi:hypothetical protein